MSKRTTLAGQRVAVLGATGFVGSHLVERLVADGAEALSLARSGRRLHHLEPVLGCHRHTFRLCDITDAGEVQEALTGFAPRVVFHLAAQPDASESYAQMTECVRINALGGLYALQAAQAAGAEVFVYADSVKVYGNGPVPYREEHPVQPICSYAMTKVLGWQLCQMASALGSIRTVALCPTFIYGPRQNWNIIAYVQRCVEEGHPVRLQGGSQTRDPLHVEDAVEAFLAAAVRPEAWGHAISIGGGREITVTDLCQAVVQALGSGAEVQQGAEAPRMTEIWRSFSDNSEARQLLGWAPRVGLEEGLARTFCRPVVQVPEAASAAIIAARS